VLSPGSTTVDAAFDLAWAGGVVRFGGDLAAVGVSIQNDALASDPVENVSLGLSVRGTVNPDQRRIELEKVEGRVRDLTARLSGTIELPRGTYKFQNGRKLGFVPKVDLTFAVPRLPCAKCWPARPRCAAPGTSSCGLRGGSRSGQGRLRRSRRAGPQGKVGIDGCKVVRRPRSTALAGEQSIIVNAEVFERLGGHARKTERWPSPSAPELDRAL
jgi:hypothetical protein